MVTIKDIAKMAGVSRTTVSRVINNSGYVSGEARKRVLKVVEQTGYVPSEQAKSLRTKKTKVIGVILPKISTETSSRVVNGMDEELSKHGYQILLANTNLNEKKEIEHLRLLQSRRVDGIILVATNINDKLMNEIHELKVPVVALGQDMPSVPSVVYDDYSAACDVTRLLIEKGHHRIGFIGVSEKDRAVGYLRQKAYVDVLKENDLPIEEGWVQQAVFNIDSGCEAMKNMLIQSKVRPTAVFAVTDRLAIGAMEAIKEANIQIPKEISLIGIGASDMSMYVTPRLSTVDYENEKAGSEAAKLLINQINNGGENSRKLSMKYRLLIRDSLI
ncbi:LacI family transcriptional regulator [Bacillus shivajii]|uniref:LacI family DNA-binding transcriptional regulator n=1 Tax=Bacillus shivajii TaxID=1983719 RepID=UPI001CFBE345|nr:LacI family DNA-binding transcriptional regulator [Bacillus shivajii]UCZ53643.1 LacI family transcriptional regulator [Bacillus shivajii]